MSEPPSQGAQTRCDSSRESSIASATRAGPCPDDPKAAQRQLSRVSMPSATPCVHLARESNESPASCLMKRSRSRGTGGRTSGNPAGCRRASEELTRPHVVDGAPPDTGKREHLEKEALVHACALSVISRTIDRAHADEARRFAECVRGTRDPEAAAGERFMKRFAGEVAGRDSSVRSRQTRSRAEQLRALGERGGGLAGSRAIPWVRE